MTTGNVHINCLHCQHSYAYIVQSLQLAHGAQLAFYPIGWLTKAPKAAGAWSWPLSSI
jgi:hypothetical protein